MKNHVKFEHTRYRVYSVPRILNFPMFVNVNSHLIRTLPLKLVKYRSGNMFSINSIFTGYSGRDSRAQKSSSIWFILYGKSYILLENFSLKLWSLITHHWSGLKWKVKILDKIKNDLKTLLHMGTVVNLELNEVSEMKTERNEIKMNPNCLVRNDLEV